MSREVPPGAVPGGESSSIELAAQQGNHRREVKESGNATVGTEGVTQGASPDPLLEPLISGAPDSDIETGVDADQSEALEEILNILWIKGVTDTPHNRLKEALELWKSKEDLFTARIDRKNKQSSDFQNEVYQLVGFYSVFQGVLLTAVAQSTLLHCNNTWTATLLSALVSFVTVIGVFLKFRSIWTLKNTIRDEESTRKALVSWQLRLREMTREFDFNKHAVMTAANSKKPSRWLIVPFYAVEVVLVIFSFAFVASIRQILCNPGHSLLP